MKTAAAIPAAMDDYQAQDDMRTLTRAEEIKADAKRHQKALSHGQQQMAALKNVVQPDADDKAGVKEKGEGTKAEEAQDAKLPKRGQRTATNAATKAMGAAKRPMKINRATVI
jgi:hypothetical protein